MTRKTSEKRKAAFFTALAETGNQTISAERARVSRSWVVQWQARDPDFRAQMDSAITTARDRLAGAGSPQPSEGWQDIDGEELVLRGVNNRRMQVARAGLGQWTPRIEARFLATLAATCNVTAACREVGLTTASAYYRKSKWPGFAERWDESLATGYLRLEMAMIENASNMLEGVAVDHDAPMPPMSVDQAIHLLHMHKRSQRGVGGLRHTGLKPADPEASVADIMKQVERVKRLRDAGMLG